MIADAYRQAGLSNEWRKEKGEVQGALNEIAKCLPAVRYCPIGVLGVGGSAIVLRVSDKLFPSVDNALKFPRPIEGVAPVLAEMIANELRFLADLRDPGMVRILYYRTINDVAPYGSLPFYLMEVVNGESSCKYLAEKANQATFLKVMLETARTLRSLHNHPSTSYAHLDIKPKNIMITGNGDPVLLDLGTSKRLDGSQDLTVLALTPDFAHPSLIRLLVAEPNAGSAVVGRIARGVIEPTWDLWAFGRTVLAWMGVRFDDGSLEAGALAERLDAYTRKYLYLLCARLLSDVDTHWLIKKVGVDEVFIKSMAIKTADQLVAQIGKLVGISDPISLVPELAAASTGSIQAAPGVHVTNTKRLTSTLEHRLFRRLNAITQLGIVSQIFPGAKHTRREHSLGTYGNVCRMVNALYADPMSPLFRQFIEEREICDLLLASLLHDLGQFPMAHDLEDIDDRVFDHEDLTQAMLKGVWKTGKRGSKTLHFESLVPIFAMWGTTAERVISILSAKSKSTTASQKDKLLRSIISGPLDADKLDYLFRDARYTDVPYPNGIDVDRLFRCLTTVVVPKIAGGVENVPAIGVHAKGKVAAEFLTMARYAMFSQVYWHHAVRAQKAMLARAVATLLAKMTDSEKEKFRAEFLEMVCALPESMYRNKSEQKHLFNSVTVPESATNLSAGTDLVATDAAVLTWLRDRMNAKSLVASAELIQGILTRKLFKRLWVVSRNTVDGKEWDDLCDLWGKLSANQKDIAARQFEKKIALRLGASNPAIDVTMMKASDATQLATQLTGAMTPWLLIDLPGAKSGSDVGLHYVSEVQARRMRKDDRAIGTLEASAAWTQYAGNLRSAAGNVRVFCDERLVETVDASILQNAGFADLLSVVQAESISSAQN